MGKLHWFCIIAHAAAVLLDIGTIAALIKLSGNLSGVMSFIEKWGGVIFLIPNTLGNILTGIIVSCSCTALDFMGTIPSMIACVFTIPLAGIALFLWGRKEGEILLDILIASTLLAQICAGAALWLSKADKATKIGKLVHRAKSLRHNDDDDDESDEGNKDKDTTDDDKELGTRRAKVSRKKMSTKRNDSSGDEEMELGRYSGHLSQGLLTEEEEEEEARAFHELSKKRKRSSSKRNKDRNQTRSSSSQRSGGIRNNRHV